MNQFSERYRNISNADLFRVIENQTDYQPEAIEAAKNELNQRKLTDQVLTAVKVEMKAEQQEKEEYRKKRNEVERKVKKLGASALDTINPIQRSATTPEKIIRLITIVFGLIAILKWYDQFGLASFMLSEISSGWDSSMVEYFLPLLLLPIAVIFFLVQKKNRLDSDDNIFDLFSNNWIGTNNHDLEHGSIRNSGSRRPFPPDLNDYPSLSIAVLWWSALGCNKARN